MIELNGKDIIFNEKGNLKDWINSHQLNNFQIIVINDGKENVKINKKHTILFSINFNETLNLKQLINKLKKTINKCHKKKVKIGIENGNKNIIGEILGGSIQKEDKLIECIKVSLIADKRKRIKYIYEQVCKDLDEDFAKNNYCDFKNDICIGKRNCNEKVTMGCCHKFKNPITMSGGLKECPYLKNKHCSTECITCKLFTCDAIKVKFRLKDIPLIAYYFNPIQKLIVKTSFFTSKEKIIDRLVFWQLNL